MGSVVQIPTQPAGNRYENRLKTAGDQWTTLEKKLIDKAEFLEAMILVLDDVRMTNIRKRDYAMMEIVGEEIPHYQERLTEVQDEIAQLRRNYWTQHPTAIHQS